MKTELQCACCGKYAGRYEQHWNRDHGYGACEGCYIDTVKKEGIESALSQYGVPGHNLKASAELEKVIDEKAAHIVGAYARKQGIPSKLEPFKTGRLSEIYTLGFIGVPMQ